LPHGVYIDASKSTILYAGQRNDSIYEYTVTNGLISTATYNSISVDLSSQITRLANIALSNDETKLYAIDEDTEIIYQYSVN